MNCGLCTKELEIIQEILSRYEAVQSAVLFGSRVTGNFKTASDVDIALKGAITIKLIAKIKADFEDSNLPFFVDIVDYAKADNALKNEIDTQGVMLYPHFKATTNTWQRVKLGEVAEINPPETIKKTTIAKKVSMNNLEPFSKKIYSYNIEVFKSGSKFRNGDALLARITPCLENGKTAFVDFLEDDEIAFGSTEFIVLRQRENISNSHFLYYLARSEKFRETAIKSMTGSSGRERVQIKAISEYEFPLPPLEIQNQIATILSSFDDKIDLLHRQNKTLESLALTLFRHTFINNPNRDEWKEKPLSEIAEIQNGFAFKNSDYIEQSVSTYEVLKMGHIESGGGLRYSPKAHYVKSNDKITKWILNEDDIVLAMTDMKDSLGILGYPAMVDKSNYYVLNQRVARMYIKCKEILVHNYLLFLFLKENVQELQALGNGGVQVNLSTEAIKNFKFVIPPIKFQTQYLEFFMRILNKYKNNRRQIQSLQQTRDMLLSKIFNKQKRE